MFAFSFKKYGDGLGFVFFFHRCLGEFFIMRIWGILQMFTLRKKILHTQKLGYNCFIS